MAATYTDGNSFYQASVDPYTYPNTEDLDDITRSLSFGFEYLNRDDVIVVAIATGVSYNVRLIEGVDYTLDEASKTITCVQTSWRLNSAVLGWGANIIRIYRSTTNQALVDFTSGAPLNENDLDLAYKQNLFAAQEMAEDAAKTSAGIQTVNTGLIQTNAVTTAKIAPLAVNNSKLSADAVSTVKIEDNAVTLAKMDDLSVDVNKLTTDAVTTVKIKDLNVTTGKLADDAVTYAKVAVPDKADAQVVDAQQIMTGDVLKYSPLAPKCYGTVTYGSSDAVAHSSSFNVASVTEPTGTDIRRITFTNALTDANYVVLVTYKIPNNQARNAAYVTAQDATHFDIKTGTSEVNGELLNFVVFGSTYA